MRLPTYEQLRHYWCVMQGEMHGEECLPCAMFLLECDAKDWIEKQESKEVYSVQKPLAYRR